MTKKILLLGAYGYTGRLITKKLIGQKITFTAFYINSILKNKT
jgi:short subunit dehydrogenase-like uncharacterized protein